MSGTVSGRMARMDAGEGCASITSHGSDIRRRQVRVCERVPRPWHLTHLTGEPCQRPPTQPAPWTARSRKCGWSRRGDASLALGRLTQQIFVINCDLIATAPSRRRAGKYWMNWPARPIAANSIASRRQKISGTGLRGLGDAQTCDPSTLAPDGAVEPRPPSRSGEPGRTGQLRRRFSQGVRLWHGVAEGERQTLPSRLE